MSLAQKILLASHLILYYLRDAGRTLDPIMLLEFYRRVERWCVEAQTRDGAT